MSERDALALLAEFLDDAPERRAARLDELAAHDPDTAASLRRWLAADAEVSDAHAAGPLHPGRYAALAIDETADAVPERIGAYRLIRELGRGGMGTVLLVERADGAFVQQAALKLIKRGMDSDAVQARFLAERQILARLAHPNIARLLDGGVAPDGRPYFVLEHVDGEPLLKFAHRNGLDLRARLTLFLKLCSAVAYAHARLVVHRDLKPSNVLVQADGEPKLLDFGIAKVLDADADAADASAHGQRFLTPAYAAPEQLAGEPVSTATDTYALGAILHELLTGTRASASADSAALRSTGRPSAARALAADDGPAGIRPQQLKGDLDTIVLHALAAEPARRYPGAQQLADDIVRHLEGHPVLARPDSARYRAAKFVQRHRTAVAASALTLLALLMATAVSVQQTRVAREEAARAQREAAAAEAVKTFLLDAFTSADPYKTEGRQVSARELLEAGADKIDTTLAQQPLVRAQLHEAFGDTFDKLDQNARAESHYRRALEAYRSGGAGDTPAALAVEVGLLNLRFQTSQLDGLERDLRALIARIGERTGELLTLRTDALTLLSYTLSTQGRYAQSVVVAEQLVALSIRERGERDRASAFAIYALSLARADLGPLLPEAQAVERYVALDVLTLGPGNPGLVTDLQSIARMLGETGYPERALPIIRAAVDARMRHFGAEHRLTASAWGRLAATEALLGQDADADAHYRQAIAAMARGSGSQHDKVAVLRQEFARFLITRGQLDEARTLLEDALPVWSRLGGVEHPRHRACAALLAEIDARLGDVGALARLRGFAQQQRTAGDLALPRTLAALADLEQATDRDGARRDVDEAVRILDAQQRTGSALAKQARMRLAELGGSVAPPADGEIDALALRLEQMSLEIIRGAGPAAAP